MTETSCYNSWLSSLQSDPINIPPSSTFNHIWLLKKQTKQTQDHQIVMSKWVHSMNTIKETVACCISMSMSRNWKIG